MESYMPLGFVGILRESHKIFSKNGKLMASITLLTLLLNSFLFLSIGFSLKPLMNDLIQNLLLVNPSSPELANLLINLKKDFGFIVGLEWIWVLVSSFASLFLLTATIFASAITHVGNYLTFNSLLSRALRSWKRPFVTWFYTTLFGLGYFFLILAILLPLVLIIEPPAASFAVSIAVTILASVFYVYIAVVWTLALIISVLEEMSGIEALGKAAQIVKGMKTHGFLLNLLFTILARVLMQGIRFIGKSRSMTTQIIIGLLVVNSICLVRMVWLMAYTVFYCQCKKIHGEKVELPGNVEYTKIPTAPLIGENIP